MTDFTRRDSFRLLAAAPLLTTGLHRAAWAMKAEKSSAQPDWSRLVIDGMLHRTPDPRNLSGWGYAVSLFLYGQYLFYKRTKERKYLDYIQGWVDKHVNDGGVIDRPITALDYVLPGNLLLILHKETGQKKYKTAADTIRHTFDNYPRTEDGGFWHALSRQHQLWLDGIFMGMPFLVRYGVAYGESKYTFDEAAKQFQIYASHLNDPKSGLMFHAYDESGAQPWADPSTHHSAYFWCRAIGWFGMALIEVLELMPHSHPQREKLIAQLRQLCEAYTRYQDKETGLWFQIVDKGDDPNNWRETSSSCMYTYTLSMAVKRGYIAKRYAEVAAKGYKGVLTQLSKDDDGFGHIANICEGTNVGDLAYYYNRPRRTDDFHGLGAFLIMNEHMRTV
ncbi:glycoside hydrolase family 88/105 protein [Terriglobus albidus]|uniref:glycoside hydrolase family 88/105 protein n=1 Tax=Terriglobus albidus TaxID=1592106 RepID=UPI0021DFE490|nr:glycoside hydrolase family 88 protein [Terriglobus albidus]